MHYFEPVNKFYIDTATPVVGVQQYLNWKIAVIQQFRNKEKKNDATSVIHRRTVR